MIIVDCGVVLLPDNVGMDDVHAGVGPEDVRVQVQQGQLPLLHAVQILHPDLPLHPVLHRILLRVWDTGHVIQEFYLITPKLVLKGGEGGKYGT